MDAFYNLPDDTVRLELDGKPDETTLKRLRDASFRWWPGRRLNVAKWSTRAEDLAIELAGLEGLEVREEADDPEERSDRYKDYSANAKGRAERAREAVSSIADNIPLGQPILVGHHSERHARRDAQKIENGMRKTIDELNKADYWKGRAHAAVSHAAFKARPDVIGRRIKGFEARLRADLKAKQKTEMCLKFWNGELKGKKKDSEDEAAPIEVTRGTALWFANHYDDISMCFPLAEYPRAAPASQYEGMISLWSALGGSDGEEKAIINAEQAKEIAIKCHSGMLGRHQRWIDHLEMVLQYQRALYAESGGTVADKKGPEVGGGCRCWVATIPRTLPPSVATEAEI